MGNENYSSLRDVNGGSPLGTLLGNCLFIITTDDLEEKLTPTDEMTETQCEKSSTFESARSKESENSFSSCESELESLPPPRPIVRTSTPSMRGQFQSFEPAPLTSSEESEGEFDYHQKYRRPYNRVEDTQN